MLRVLVDPGRDPGTSDCLGSKGFPGTQLELQGGMPGLDRGVVQRGAGSAHGLTDTQPPTSLPEGPRGVLAALIGMQNDPSDLPTAHRHGHGEGSVGQVGVVVFGQGEPDHPAGEDVQHRRQVQLALPGGDLGAVTEPLLVG